MQTEPGHERKKERRGGGGGGIKRGREERKRAKRTKRQRVSQQGTKRPREYMGTKRVCGQEGWFIKD